MSLSAKGGRKSSKVYALGGGTRASGGSWSLRSLQTQVTFHSIHRDVQFGEQVRVVGNLPVLGSWNPSQGLLLQTGDIFPCWISPEPILVETGTVVEYKYVVVSESSGSEPRWEGRDGNRHFVASGAKMVIEDDGGLYRQHWDGADADEDDDEEPLVPVAGPEPTTIDKEERLALVRSFEELDGAVVESHDTIFLLAFRLPVTVVKLESGGWIVDDKAPTDGRNFAMAPLIQELRVKKKMRVMNVGWPGVHVDNIRERQELERKLLEHQCIPVFPPRHEFQVYVNFYTSFLWPLFHDSMADFQTAVPLSFDEHGWAAYQAINMFYARAVMPHTHTNDIIWVHDYHLLLTPSFIARKLHRANVGFYLHTPFPSVNAFMTIPVREELIVAMLCSDLVGFQFSAYTRNFFLAVKRIAGLDPAYKPGGIIYLDYNGRQVHIRASHFVYPFEDTKRVVDHGGVAQKAAELAALLPGRIIFAGMDRCDGLSGLVPKFQAFKRFLQERPQYKGKAILIQYVFDDWEKGSSLMQSLEAHADASMETDEEGRLTIVCKNGDMDSACIVLRSERTERSDRLALFRAAGVLLDTCVKAGLNLMPFEFVTAHHDDEEKGRCGVSIVSEFSGCSRVLLGSLRVNPWNTSEVSKTCAMALEMSAAQKTERALANIDYTMGNDPVMWFEDFLLDMRRARKKEGYKLETLGFGAKMRQVSVAQDFTKLSEDLVLSAYRNSKNRLLFLDNEGTLSANKQKENRQWGSVSDLNSRGAPPDEHVLSCLRKLCEDPRNTVVILSGRDRACMQEWFGDVKGIGLAAERGFYFKVPVATGEQWHCMAKDADVSWKDQVFSIMALFVKRTQGSFIENKGSALVWQYRDADQVFGAWQAKELATSLRDLLYDCSDVEIMEGKGYVEVKLRGINKGVAVTKVLSKVNALFGGVDFILSIGDDRSDEAMFEAINAFLEPVEDVDVDDQEEESTTADSEVVTTSDQPDNPARSTSSQLLPRHNSDDGGFPRTFSGGLGARRPMGGMLGNQSFGGAFGGLAGLAGGSDAGSRSGFRRLGSNDSDLGMMPRKFFTCTVGRKPSAAKFYLDDVEEVSELLGNLKAQHERKPQSDRTMALPSYHTWSGGMGLRDGKASRLGSMPALSSLAFGPSMAMQRTSSMDEDPVY